MITKPASEFEDLQRVEEVGAAMAQASAPDDSDDELQLLAALERDLEAVSLSDDELEGEDQELPDVVPLGSVEELLAAAAAAAAAEEEEEQPEEEGGPEDLLAQLRASLEDGERQRQCFMEDVEALHGLTSTVEPQVMAPAAEAHEADGSGWAGEEPWWVEERRQQAEAERAREEQRRQAQEEMERQQEAQRLRQQEKLEARQAEQEKAFAAQQAALLAAQEARRREQEEQRQQALVREAEAEAERQREVEAAAAAEQRYMEREVQYARRQQERKQRAKAAAAAFAAAEAERERIDELKRREKEVRCAAKCTPARHLALLHNRPALAPPPPSPPPASTPPAAHRQPTH